MTIDSIPSLVISELLASYRAQRVTPKQFFTSLLSRIDAAPERHVWITRLGAEKVLTYVAALAGKPTSLPLYGIPFVIKDNIDLAGVPTTAGCPGFSYMPTATATVVQQLIDAGAIPLGKTNMDQFATGLVGVRSPYGAGRNSFNPEYISGGSSSGSALAVALGFASFALGTDTAGSGRVPAAFNNIVGLKPSCGRLSTTGLVPACRSLDCISIFALTAGDAAAVLQIAQGYDAADPWSRSVQASVHAGPMLAERFRVGVPMPQQLQFFGDSEYGRLFAAARLNVESIGGKLVELDFAPLLEAARLLYEGPWVAERYAAIDSFIERTPEAMHPVTREITLGARGRTAVQAFQAQYRLQTLKHVATTLLAQADVLMTPTAGTIYRIAEVEADPIRLNSNLGYYTNFMNLLDLAAVAVPSGFRQDGLPFGVTLFAERDTDDALLQLAGRLHHASVSTLGAMSWPLPSQVTSPLLPGYLPVAVCGAHMHGLPLNAQLTSRGAYLLQRTRTAAQYRFFALPGGPPQRPGLVRVASAGVPIEVEVWALPHSQWGTFMAGIPAPLCLGQVMLESGEQVTGFLCEAHAMTGARDISSFGGWRAWLVNAP